MYQLMNKEFQKLSTFINFQKKYKKNISIIHYLMNSYLPWHIEPEQADEDTIKSDV